MSKASKAYMGRVAELGCVLCRELYGTDVPANVHHLFDPHQRSDWLTVPLCHAHHQGPGGFHGLGGERPFKARYKLGEVELLAMTIERLNGG